jgi:large repetitive protein
MLAVVLMPLSLRSANDTENRPHSRDLGFTYQNDRDTEVPWSIHVVKIDRTHQDLELHTTLAGNTVFGLTTLTDQIKGLPPDLGRPLAAINGDFYRDDRAYAGDPKGLQIMRGELVSAPSDWSCFYIDTAGTPHMATVVSQLKVTWPTGKTTEIGLNEERNGKGATLYTPRMGPSTRTSGGREIILERDADGLWLPLQAGENYTARVREIRESGDTPLSPAIMVLSLNPQLASQIGDIKRGATLKISTATTPDLRGVKTALGGGPALVRDGKIVVTTDGRGRHPRSAVGWNKDHFFMVEVDGRQRGLSVGMNFQELASYMMKLGCDTALNLDGGGSATFWVMGQVMNSPSEGRPRGSANGLVLIQKDRNARAND